jgi:DNA polymerase I
MRVARGPGKDRKKVLLLDGHSLAYRAFYALPPDLRTTSGQLTNAVYGFTSMLIKALQDEATRHVAVAFDSGRPAERLAIRPEYKAQRTAAPDEFRQQMGLIREVLDALEVPVFEFAGIEADDVIYVLGSALAEEGHEVIVVTADRDFFQMVGPGVKLMMNRRGISETVVYDEAALHQRYGFGPEQYLDYAALRGDPSDNIEGVKGVGEKTAEKLIQTHGTLEEVFGHLGDLKPKLAESLAEAKERLLANREFFRFRTAADLATQGVDAHLLEKSAADIVMGEWDFEKIRRLFDALEFRSLYERLADLDPEAGAPTARAGFEAETKEASTLDELRALVAELSASPVVFLRASGDASNYRSAPDVVAFESKGAAWTVKPSALGGPKVWKELRPLLEGSKLATHGSKEAIMRLDAAGVSAGEFVMDTEIAAYLVDPARGAYELDDLSNRCLGRDLRIDRPDSAVGQQSLALEVPPTPVGSTEPTIGLEAVAVAELSSVLEKELRERGGWDLLGELELPLARVLAKVETAGIKIDTGYLDAMSSKMTSELRTIEEEIFNHAGEPFNVGSTPQLRRVLYEKLGLRPSKKTKTGFSTDANVLESLREEHPIVDAILKFREKSKLKSTYIDALPPLVDPATGRIHCRFNQTVAATGRLSSERPNLQNIPIRSVEGRQIRRAFIPDEGNVLLVADYSQIELRILAHLCEDPELVAAFERGDDIHRRSIAKALGISETEVSPELRSIGKMVSYGVTYGMGPFGLSQRLRIPVDQARNYIDSFFALYPKVRTYLDEVVARAAEEGFTTTMLGRRRYLPELTSRNPRVRSLGERMALNAPIQGSAADVIKLAMVKADRALEKMKTRMILTVHDELVFEAPEKEVEAAAAKVQEAMETAIELRVPLKADIAWGPNWAEAKH